MPVAFLSTADHQLLTRCPDELPQADLVACFQLTPVDLTILGNQAFITNESKLLRIAVEMEEMIKIPSPLPFLSRVRDPRQPGEREHRWETLWLRALLAVACRQENILAMAQWCVIFTRFPGVAVKQL